MPERPPRPTIREIAEETGLSTAAVSYALRGMQVSAETEQRVRETADRLGYRQDPIARALRGGETGTFGLVAALQDFWNQDLVAALQRRLRASDRHLLIADNGGDASLEAELALSLVDRRVDGLLVLPTGPLGKQWSDVASQVPTVALCDGLPEAETAGEVVWDSEAGVRAVLTHLAELGHTRVAALSWSRAAALGRVAERALPVLGEELGLEIEAVPCPRVLDVAQQVAHDLLSRDDRPTAVFALSDSIAYGVLAACRDLGLGVPADVSVSGYADHPLSRLVWPSLTSVDWDIEGTAKLAVTLLLDAASGAEPAERTTLAPRLVVRASTGAPPPA